MAWLNFVKYIFDSLVISETLNSLEIRGAEIQERLAESIWKNNPDIIKVQCFLQDEFHFYVEECVSSSVNYCKT